MPAGRARGVPIPDDQWDGSFRLGDMADEDLLRWEEALRGENPDIVLPRTSKGRDWDALDRKQRRAAYAVLAQE